MLNVFLFSFSSFKEQLKKVRQVTKRSDSNTATMDPSEVEFLAEKEHVKIVPNFTQDTIYLISVSHCFDEKDELG